MVALGGMHGCSGGMHGCSQGEGACMAKGGMHGKRGGEWRRGGMHGEGEGHAWYARPVIAQVVRILLECILVNSKFIL